MSRQPTPSSLEEQGRRTTAKNKRMCRCGHKFAKHEELKKSDGTTVTPCMNFEKLMRKGYVMSSVCRCPNFEEAGVPTK